MLCFYLRSLPNDSIGLVMSKYNTFLSDESFLETASSLSYDLPPFPLPG